MQPPRIILSALLFPIRTILFSTQLRSTPKVSRSTLRMTDPSRIMKPYRQAAQCPSAYTKYLPRATNDKGRLQRSINCKGQMRRSINCKGHMLRFVNRKNQLQRLTDHRDRLQENGPPIASTGGSDCPYLKDRLLSSKPRPHFQKRLLR